MNKKEARLVDPAKSKADLEAMARRVIDAPELMEEVLRLLSWIDEARLLQITAACHRAMARKLDMLGAIKDGSFAEFVERDMPNSSRFAQVVSEK